MHLLIVGSGASDISRYHQCLCPNCSNVRRLGGKNVRSYSSLLIDGNTLIDCGPTVPSRLQQCEISLQDISNILITHWHPDHFDVAAIQVIAKARQVQGNSLNLWGDDSTIKRILLISKRLDVRLRTISKFQVYPVNQLLVTVLPANHSLPVGTAYNFVVQADANLLYAADTAWPLPETLAYLKTIKLDAAIVEATFGSLNQKERPSIGEEHLNLSQFLQLRKLLLTMNVLNNQATYIATHLSPHYVPPYEQFETEAKKSGAIVAWDGMRLKIPRS